MFVKLWIGLRVAKLNRYADIHTHSRFSCDSKAEIDDMCQRAMDKGLKAICITDHIDYNPNDYGYNYYQLREYMQSISDVKDKYKDKLIVLSGIEFSEPHIYKEQLEEFQSKGFDVILGSIHWLDHEFVGQKELLQKYPQIEVEQIYYGMILDTIKHGGFDVLAHLDFPKRYYGNSVIGREVLTEILIALVGADIALEINTSSLRKGVDECMPSLSIVEEYIKLGGKKLTLGSDAHVLGDIGGDFEQVVDMLSEEAKDALGIYVNRRFMKLSDL